MRMTLKDSEIGTYEIVSSYDFIESPAECTQKIADAFKHYTKKYYTDEDIVFLDLRGLLDAFVEYIRPKTMQERLAEKKAIVEYEKKAKSQEVDVKRKRDIAI